MSENKICKKKNCNNIHIPGGKYCEIHRVGTLCKKENCKSIAKRPSKFCVKHGGGKRCKYDGCESSAASPADFCKKHGGGIRCKENDCTTSAKRPSDYCIKHGGGVKCKEKNCLTSAQYPTNLCKKHGGGFRCIQEGCKSSAGSLNNYCKNHGGGKRCQEEGCRTAAQNSTDYCIKHGGGKICKEEGCKSSAKGKTDFCYLHNGGILKVYPERACVNCKYIYVEPKYRFNPYCFACYCVLNPGIEIPRQFKLKEHLLVDELKKVFTDVTMIFDKTIDEGCSKRRPDIRIEKFTHTIIIENDEKGDNHNSTCDNLRTMQIFKDLGNRPLVLLRFNPDGYTKNNKRNPSCFKYSEKTNRLQINDKKEWKLRVNCLIERMNYYLNNIPEKEVQIEYLFFNEI